MFSKVKQLSLFILVLVIIFALYLLLNPLFFVFERIFTPRKLENITEAREYYGLLSQIFGIFITASGLTLGYFYYKDKLKYDKKCSTRDRKKSRLEYLIKELNRFDNFVDEIISFTFDDATELKHLRAKVSRSFEVIVIMLEEDAILGFSDNEIKIILEVNSYVEQNNVLMCAEFQEITDDSLLSEKNKYLDKIQSAKRTCIRKIE